MKYLKKFEQTLRFNQEENFEEILNELGWHVENGYEYKYNDSKYEFISSNIHVYMHPHNKRNKHIYFDYENECSGYLSIFTS